MTGLLADLRQYSLECLWAIEALQRIRAKPKPITDRDHEARMIQLQRACSVCEKDVREWDRVVDDELSEILVKTRAGDPVRFGQLVYPTAHHAARGLAFRAADFNKQSHGTADKDAEHYEQVYVEAMFAMIRTLPRVDDLEVSVEHEYSLAVDDEQTPPMLLVNASVIHKATSGGLNHDTLRKARKDGRIWGEKQGGRWVYDAYQVAMCWKEYRPLIHRFIDETGKNGKSG